MSWGSNAWGDLTGSNERRKARQDIKEGINKATATLPTGYSNARNYLTDALNQMKVRSGGFKMVGNELVADPNAKGSYGTQADYLTGAYDPTTNTGSGFKGALGTAQQGFTKARTDYTGGMDKARENITGGYDTAETELRGGYDTAKDTLTGAYDTGRKDITSGYEKAQGWYDTPEMVSSRAELYQRVLGNGGYSPQSLEQMKAGAREEYGTGMRGAEQSLNSYYGDSGAGGLAGENLAIASSQLGANRANAVRDIDIGNEQLKRQEMTDAITSLGTEAYQRAGLSAEEARYLSDIDIEKGTALANLSVNLGSGLAALATEEGAALAGLNAEEAAFLGNLAQSEGTTMGQLMVDYGKSMSDLTAEEANFLNAVDSAYGTDMASLSTEEAAMMAQIFTGGGAALASTRDTTNYLALLASSAVQGAAAGMTAGMTAGAGGGTK